MPKLFYAVTATINDRATARDYLAWLAEGHTAAVIDGGAESARVIVLDHDDGANDEAAPTRIETQYVFPSREAFAAYEAGPAIPLREEGKRRFATRGIAFERRSGKIT